MTFLNAGSGFTEKTTFLCILVMSPMHTELHPIKPFTVHGVIDESVSITGYETAQILRCFLSSAKVILPDRCA